LLSVDPISSKDVGELVYPTISLKNIGNMPIHEIPLSIKVNNVEVVTETIDTLLNPGDSLVYTFEMPYSVPNATEQQPYYQMKVEIDLSCDGVPGNNSNTKFYNVNVEGSIDLSIVQVLKPLADSCKQGFEKVYPSLEVYNSGTGYAEHPILYVLIDSVGVQIQAFSETLDDVVSQGTISYNCSNYYTVPNFDGKYNVVFKIEFAKDANKANNSTTVTTCATKKPDKVENYSDVLWTLGQNKPNPATSSVSIPYSLPKEGMITFKVMTINGQILHQESINVNEGSHELEFNTETLANGIYYYAMEYEGQRIVKKMTIQK